MANDGPKYRVFPTKSLAGAWYELKTASCKSSLKVRGFRPNASECLHKTKTKSWVIEVIFDDRNESFGQEISLDEAVDWMVKIGSEMLGDLSIFEHFDDFDSSKSLKTRNRVTFHCVRCRALEKRLTTSDPSSKRGRMWTKLSQAEKPLSAKELCALSMVENDSYSRGILSLWVDTGIAVKLSGKKGYVASSNMKKIDLS